MRTSMARPASETRDVAGETSPVELEPKADTPDDAFAQQLASAQGFGGECHRAHETKDSVGHTVGPPSAALAIAGVSAETSRTASLQDAEREAYPTSPVLFLSLGDSRTSLLNITGPRLATWTGLPATGPSGALPARLDALNVPSEAPPSFAGAIPIPSMVTTDRGSGPAGKAASPETDTDPSTSEANGLVSTPPPAGTDVTSLGPPGGQSSAHAVALGSRHTDAASRLTRDPMDIDVELSPARVGDVGPDDGALGATATEMTGRRRAGRGRASSRNGAEESLEAAFRVAGPDGRGALSTQEAPVTADAINRFEARSGRSGRRDPGNASTGSEEQRAPDTDRDPPTVARSSERLEGPLPVHSAPARADGSPPPHQRGVGRTPPSALVDQLVERLRVVTLDGRHAFSLRLEPPDLGGIRVEASVHGRQLVLHIRTEAEEARGLLVEGLPRLRESLAQHGVVVEHASVTLGLDTSTRQDRQEGSSPEDRLPLTLEPQPPASAPGPSVRPLPADATVDLWA